MDAYETDLELPTQSKPKLFYAGGGDGQTRLRERILQLSAEDHNIPTLDTPAAQGSTSDSLAVAPSDNDAEPENDNGPTEDSATAPPMKNICHAAWNTRKGKQLFIQSQLPAITTPTYEHINLQIAGESAFVE